MLSRTKIIPVVIISSVLMSGCINQKTVKNTDTAPVSERLATQQAKDFFSEHPEYLNSKEQEARLFAEFQKVTHEKGYENMSMYQMLTIAHDRLQN